MPSLSFSPRSSCHQGSTENHRGPGPSGEQALQFQDLPGQAKLPRALQSTGMRWPYCFTGRPRPPGTISFFFFCSLLLRCDLLSKKVPGGALQSAYHNPQLDETELKQNITMLLFRPKIANKQINKLADAVGG